VRIVNPPDNFAPPRESQRRLQPRWIFTQRTRPSRSDVRPSNLRRVSKEKSKPTQSLSNRFTKTCAPSIQNGSSPTVSAPNATNTRRASRSCSKHCREVNPRLKRVNSVHRGSNSCRLAMRSLREAMLLLLVLGVVLYLYIFAAGAALFNLCGFVSPPPRTKGRASFEDCTKVN